VLRIAAAVTSARRRFRLGRSLVRALRMIAHLPVVSLHRRPVVQTYQHSRNHDCVRHPHRQRWQVVLVRRAYRAIVVRNSRHRPKGLLTRIHKSSRRCAAKGPARRAVAGKEGSFPAPHTCPERDEKRGSAGSRTRYARLTRGDIVETSVARPCKWLRCSGLGGEPGRNRPRGEVEDRSRVADEFLARIPRASARGIEPGRNRNVRSHFL
jgi:hypothetical protein